MLMQAVFRRSQLKALVSIHSREENFGGNLTSDEVSIIRGALDLSSKTAASVMTPLDKVCALSSTTSSEPSLLSFMALNEITAVDQVMEPARCKMRLSSVTVG